MSNSKKDLELLKKSMKKCLCPTEKPFDSNYCRQIILSTHIDKTLHPIWHIAERQSLTQNRFIAWKFFVILHKILHHGHGQVLLDAVQYCGKLENIAAYWLKQTDHMGQCIGWYCKVLLRKIQFHRTFEFINGSFQTEYKAYGDIEMWYQLSLDILDYLEDLLHLQQTIFNNLAINNISAQSRKGQCRLVALVPIINESNLLYEHCVAALRLLHCELPSDDISGIYERFCLTFGKLQASYAFLRNIELNMDSIEIPTLPPDVPSFPNYIDDRPEGAAGGTYISTAPSSPPAPLEQQSIGNVLYTPTAPLIEF